MRQTPGQLLAAELKRRKIPKSAFAKTVKRTYITINNWTKDEGFGAEQRVAAAAALQQPPDFFDRPDLAQQREQYRLDVLSEFLDSSLGTSLSPEERRSLESFRWPEGRAPTVSDCKGLVRIIRGQLTQAEFEASADAMRAADPSTPPSQKRDDTGGRQSKERGQPTKPRKPPRN
ncbi:MAG: hypothetical protein H0X39_00325 [Actinobacteria bacterium]|nr:hypothetical protein [Gemmatimonadaceae bacterium]MBA3841066.1 hypothetical protein [Actinomycetota bacterium]